MSLEPFITTLQSAFGNHVPQVLGAVAVFVLGWLVAVVARAATARLLTLLGLNRRIADSTGVEIDTERPITLGVFWLVMLATAIAVLNVLDLSMVSGPFATMLTEIVGYLPYLLAGVVLSLVAWLIASLLRAVLTRALATTSLDDRLSAQAGMTPMSASAGNVLFWVVLLLFLPSVLAAFRMDGTLGPVQGMLQQGLALLPNVIGASVIAFVGYVVARVLRGLVTNLLGAAGVDRVNERIGLDGAVKLSRLAGTLVFLLVLVPSLIAALDALQIAAVSAPRR